MRYRVNIDLKKFKEALHSLALSELTPEVRERAMQLIRKEMLYEQAVVLFKDPGFVREVKEAYGDHLMKDKNTKAAAYLYEGAGAY